MKAIKNVSFETQMLAASVLYPQFVKCKLVEFFVTVDNCWAARAVMANIIKLNLTTFTKDGMTL